MFRQEEGHQEEQTSHTEVDCQGKSCRSPDVHIILRSEELRHERSITARKTEDQHPEDEEHLRGNTDCIQSQFTQSADHQVVNQVKAGRNQALQCNRPRNEAYLFHQCSVVYRIQILGHLLFIDDFHCF